MEGISIQLYTGNDRKGKNKVTEKWVGGKKKNVLTRRTWRKQDNENRRNLEESLKKCL